MKLLFAFTLAILIASVVCPPPITTTKSTTKKITTTTQASSGGAGGGVDELTSTPIDSTIIIEPPSQPSTSILEPPTSDPISTTTPETTNEDNGGHGPIVGLIIMILNYFKNIIESILGVFGALFGM